MSLFCEVDDCTRPAFRGSVCSTHMKQKQRNGVMTPIAEQLTPEERFIRATSAWLDADAEDDDKYSALRAAALRAGVAWMRARGWIPASQAKRSRRPSRGR